MSFSTHLRGKTFVNVHRRPVVVVILEYCQSRVGVVLAVPPVQIVNEPDGVGAHFVARRFNPLVRTGQAGMITGHVQ